MIKIDIFSGFLGSGKTTLIKKLISDCFADEKVVLIENEFGEINVDSGFLKESGIEITEMNSGCICCTLVGDFGVALRDVVTKFEPDRILIEPSGVGKLSEIITAVMNVAADMPVALNNFVTVADAKKCKMYAKNFGEFYLDQIENAKTVILSRTQDMTPERLDAAVKVIRDNNSFAKIITTPWDQLTGAQILEAMEGEKTFEAAVLEEVKHEHHHEEHECCCGHDHEHHHHDDHECCGHDHEHHHHEGHDCGHHHGDEGCVEHHHGHVEEEHCAHHHHDDHECCCGHDHDHHHHHDHDHEHHHHDHECGCGHDHHHHDHDCGCGHDHHHHADEVFTSWGVETAKKFDAQRIELALKQLDSGLYGMVLPSVAGRMPFARRTMP